MTINRTFDTVTFWEVKNHKHYVLKGRIQKEEIKYLESYMSPNISKEEREKYGITDGLIRMSVGMESIQDILHDLDQALSTQ